MEPSHITVDRHNSGQRLDVVLARAYPRYSRAFLQKVMKRGGVTAGGAPVEPSYRVHSGETFDIADFGIPVLDMGKHAYRRSEVRNRHTAGGPSCSLADSKTKIAREPVVLYEDEAILVIDKPAGVVVHPAPGHSAGTLIDWLREYLGPSVAKVFTDPERLGLVHRLDKDTSGVLLIAKTIPAQTAISRQFHDRFIEKTYAAFVEGVLSAKNGVISAPVGRSRKAPTRMEVSPLGRPSETSFRVLETFGTKLSQLALFPKTGRTHQIRVHLSAIGHPIVGDQAYGAKSVWGQEFGIKRPLLHAEELKIVHPLTGKDATFKAPWPEDLKLARIRFREVFKLAAVFLVAAALGATPLAAQESSAKSGAKSSKSASAKLSALKSKVQKLQSELETLQDSVENLSKSMAEVDASRRLNDLEHALSEINGKVGGAATGTEEVKTQLLEVGRRLKGQQDTLEGLRDAMDRVQREVIQLKAMQEGAPAAAAPAGSKASAP